MTKTKDYFKTFCNISKVFATTNNKEELLNLIVNSAIETMDGKASCLFLADEEKNMFVPAASKGLSDKYIHAGAKQASIVLKEFEDTGYLVFNDATSDPRLENLESKKAEGIASILVVPVKVSAKIIGTLALYSATPRNFTPDEIDFLLVLAEHGGIAIERADLIEERRKDIELFLNLAASINSTLDIRKILHIMSADIAEAFSVKAVSIRLLDEDGKTLKLVASYGLSENYLNKGPSYNEKGIPEALKSQPVVVTDAATDDGVKYRDEKKKEGIVTILTVPIKAKQEVIGVMRLYSGKKRDFDKDEILLATAIAQQGGLAIQNASMYLKLQEDKESLEKDIWSHKSWF